MVKILNLKIVIIIKGHYHLPTVEEFPRYITVWTHIGSKNAQSELGAPEMTG